MATVNVFHEKNRKARFRHDFPTGRSFREAAIEAHVSVDFEYGDTADALDFLTKAFEAARAELEAMLPASEEPEPEVLDRNGDPLVQEEIDRLVIGYDGDDLPDPVDFDVDMDVNLDYQYIGDDSGAWFVAKGYDVDDFKPAPEFKVGQVISSVEEAKRLPVGTSLSYANHFDLPEPGQIVVRAEGIQWDYMGLPVRWVDLDSLVNPQWPRAILALP